MNQYQQKKSQDLVNEMKKWGSKKDSFHLAQFLAEREMSFKELNDFCKMAPKVAKHLEILKSKMLVNWMSRFEEVDLNKNAAAFGMQCVKNYDLDLLHITKKKIAQRCQTSKKAKVGSTEIIEDLQVVDDLSNVKLQGEAKDLYEMSLKNNQGKDETRPNEGER